MALLQRAGSRLGQRQRGVVAQAQPLRRATASIHETPRLSARAYAQHEAALVAVKKILTRGAAHACHEPICQGLDQ